MTVAELLCQGCGATSQSDLRSSPAEAALARCACGGLRQTIRIHHVPLALTGCLPSSLDDVATRLEGATSPAPPEYSPPLTGST